MSKRKCLRTLLISLVWVMGGLPATIMAESFGGFGIVVAQLYDSEAQDHRGGIVILHVPQGSEGDKAGLLAGDIVLEIDGKPTAGREFGDVVLNSLRGEPGSTSILQVRRTPGDQTFELNAKRSLITYE